MQRRFSSAMANGGMMMLCMTAGLAGPALAQGAARPANASPPALADAPPYALEKSAVLSVTSRTGTSYALMLAWPDTPPPPSGWPVLYVLDGEDNFAMVALAARRLARAGSRSGVAPGIVVGIAAGPLNRRVHDYTPPAPGYAIPEGMPAGGRAIGGGDAFLDMMARQVMPLVRRSLPVDQSREALLGHSFGGLIALHAALARPGMFDHVVAVSPSLWFGNGLIAREAADARGLSADVLLAVGSEERAQDASPDAGAALLARLRALAPERHVERIVLAGQGHGNTMAAALGDAIGFAFRRERAR